MDPLVEKNFGKEEKGHNYSNVDIVNNCSKRIINFRKNPFAVLQALDFFPKENIAKAAKKFI